MAEDRNARLVYSTEGSAADHRDRGKPRRASSPAPSAGGKGVRLRLDRRASGRVVTVVSGLPFDAPSLEAFLREMKAACGTGGTVREGAVELQGDHRPAVETLLSARGIRSKRAGG